MYKLYIFIFGLTFMVGVTNSQLRTKTKQPTNVREQPTYQEIFDSNYGNPVPLEYDKFDWELFSKISAYNSENILLSPLSVKMALSILYEAAGGFTQSEIQQTLKTSANATQNTLKMIGLREYLATPETREYILELGTRMFVDPSIPVEQKFGALLHNAYKAKIVNIDVNKPQQTADNANKWVKEVTKGNIDNILSADDLKDAVVVLINTIFFNGTWENQFEANDTKRSPFYLSSSKSVTVPMMSLTEKFFFLNSDSLEAKFLKMPYKGDKMSMILVLPNSIQGLRDLIKRLTPGLLQKEISKMTLEKVAISIPKFKFEYESHLVSALKNMGLRDIFENTASLPGLARGKGLTTKLAVSNILQKAGIELNEIGSTIYAATAITLVNKFGEDEDTPEEFLANRPFMFIVQNEGSVPAEILFVGTVDDPTKFSGKNEDIGIPEVPQASGKARTSRY